MEELNYVPYGKQWQAEIKKMSKIKIIELVASIATEKDSEIRLLEKQNAEQAALLTIGGQMARIEGMDKNMDRMAGNMELMRENEVADKMTIGQQSDRIAELEKQLKETQEQAGGMEANCYTPDEIAAIKEASYHAGKVGGYY